MLLAGPASAWDDSGIADWLRVHGWPATCAPDAERARWLAVTQKLSLVLVAGDVDQVESMIRSIRPVTRAPLAAVVAASPDQVVMLLGAGVDSVLDPTRSPAELFARVAALMRRLDHHSLAPGTRYLRAGSVQLDLWAQTCSVDEGLVHLSPTEYELLAFLMAHPQQALPVQTIVRRVWGGFPPNDRNVLRIFVNRLRRKLGEENGNWQYIETIRGTGYRFIRNVAELSDEAESSIDRTDVAALFDSVTSLTSALQGHDDVDTAGERLVDTLDASGYADGISLTRVDEGAMKLVASRRMPERWVASVAAGVPLKSTFASAHCVLTREPIQFSDVREMAPTFPDTVEHAACTDYRACLFVPIMGRDSVWGSLGLVRRSRQPFDPTGTAYLNAMCGVFALAMQ